MRIRVFASLGFSALLPLYAQVSVMPYSGTQVTQRVQTLADGTHITQPEQKTLMYRDSQGRTRTEVHPAFLNPNPNVILGMPVMINIFDPVAGFRYTLDSRSKIARRFKVGIPGRPATVQADVGLPGIAGSGGLPNTGTVSSAAAGINSPPPPPAPTRPTRPPPKIESLGTEVIEGLLCDGRRITNTTPAGTMGNDRDIVVTSENWISQELHIQVLGKASDPRGGDSIAKLTDISRAEPDPALFMVPADYKVEDQPVPGAQK